MKRLIVIGLAAVALVGCAEQKPKYEIDELNPTIEADVMSDSLARMVVEASTYEEFKAARENIEDYEEAMRTQIGGEAYLIFLEDSNDYLKEL